MSNGKAGIPSDSANTSAEASSNGAAAVATPTENAASSTGGPSTLATQMRRFFWLEERIADAGAKCLGPSQLGWREFESARDVRDAVDDTKESGQDRFAVVLLLRAQILLLIRCNLVRKGLASAEGSLCISDWETARKLPAINDLFLNLSSIHLAHVEAILSEKSETYLLGLDSKLRKDITTPLKILASELMEPLESEARVVARLKIFRWSRIAAAAAAGFVILGLAMSWSRDKAGTNNLALNRPVTVSSQIAGVGADHHALVDGDYTNIGFHTDNLPNQFAVIDLGSIKKFDKVVVYNRVDCCKERAVPVQLEVSDDNVTYKKLAERTNEFDVWTAATLRAKGRYVRLRLLATNPFHLAEVEVF